MSQRGVPRRALLTGAAGLAVAGLGVPLAGCREKPDRATDPRRPAAELAPVSMAMHVHGCFSEGKASMHAHLDQATRRGVDVLWWTDHDFRMSAHGYVTQVRFDGPTETYGPVTWTWERALEGSPAVATSEYVSEPRSPDEPGRALRLTARGDGPQYAAQWLTGVAWNFTYSTCLADTTIELDVLPETLGPDAQLAIEIVSSYHPETAGRPAGQYRLRYLLGPTPPAAEQAARPDRDDPLLGVAILPPGRPGWRRLRLQPAMDVALCWPDLVAGDNSLWRLRLGVLSRSRHQARVVVDRLRFARSQRTGDLPLRLQAELIRQYANRYPKVRQLQATEVSLVRHLNWFGGKLALPDYGDAPPVKDGTEAATRAMVERIHRAGGFASYNHPLGVGSESGGPTGLGAGADLAAHLVETRALGADAVEFACKQDLTALQYAFDVCARNALFVTATGVSDDHSGQDWINQPAPWLTHVWSPGREVGDLVAALRAGRAWVTHPGRWRGELDLTVGDRPAMGRVDKAGAATVPVRVTATELPADGSVEIIQGVVDRAGAKRPEPATESRKVPSAQVRAGVVELDVTRGEGRYLRAVVRTEAGEVAGFSNPVWLLQTGTDVDVPSARRV